MASASMMHRPTSFKEGISYITSTSVCSMTVRRLRAPVLLFIASLLLWQLLVLVLILLVLVLLILILLLLLLLLLHPLEHRLEIVFRVDIGRIQSESFLVRFETFLQLLLPIERVAEVIPCV